jgi:hypothetical protein
LWHFNYAAPGLTNRLRRLCLASSACHLARKPRTRKTAPLFAASPLHEDVTRFFCAGQQERPAYLERQRLRLREREYRNSLDYSFLTSALTLACLLYRRRTGPHERPALLTHAGHATHDGKHRRSKQHDEHAGKDEEYERKDNFYRSLGSHLLGELPALQTDGVGEDA